MKPLNDRVLVKRLESEEKTAGGLFIPDAAKEKPSKGEIVACGPGKMTADGNRVAMDVKPGDVVLLSGGNPQIAKGVGNEPVQAYIAAMPGWKSPIGQRIDALVEPLVEALGPLVEQPGDGLDMAAEGLDREAAAAL